jgi:hypothetical protein
MLIRAQGLKLGFIFDAYAAMNRRSSTVAAGDSSFLHSAFAGAPAPVGMTKSSLMGSSSRKVAPNRSAESAAPPKGDLFNRRVS